MAMSGPGERADDDDGEDEGGIFAEINVTPLVDVMLVLLIIFMVSTTIITEEVQSAGIKVDLPKSSAKGGALDKADVIIALTKEGQIVHAGESYTIEQLKDVLEE